MKTYEDYALAYFDVMRSGQERGQSYIAPQHIWITMQFLEDIHTEPFAPDFEQKLADAFKDMPSNSVALFRADIQKTIETIQKGEG